MATIPAPSLINTPPQGYETPLEYACRLAERYARVTSGEHRRDWGQFFTPPEIASLMAQLARPAPTVRRLLDPGAGTGILACALCEALPGGTGSVHLDAYESDPQLHPLCQATLAYARHWLAPRGIKLTFTVHAADFVLANAGAITPTLLDTAPRAEYDVAISNPPYFKLQKRDPRSTAMAGVVHGQPNIYALFLAITASLLKDDGILVSITPRSFTTGEYFRRFRQYFFQTMSPEAVHLFESRTATFQQDGVLQETVILCARKRPTPPGAVAQVSVSDGLADLADRRTRPVPVSDLVDTASRNVIFNIPADHTDDAIVSFVRGWPNTLHRLGLEVSTGPVVAFRAAPLLLHLPDPQQASAPLLWLQHIGPLAVTWPLPGLRKPQYIRLGEQSRPLLIANANYVVVRRFTAKEERRRLTAAPLLADQLPGGWIGLENHLNYIYRPHGQLGADEAVGLAALLSSALLDRYFRISNGNTQVNATELRALPLPPTPAVVAIGAALRRHGYGKLTLEQVTAEILHIPRSLLAVLNGENRGDA